ncbi:hypothetical protein NL676_003687 [Syzygium grande]|nr:hypothetical protein NL676_003687 [Syzygium grande]
MDETLDELPAVAGGQRASGEVNKLATGKPDVDVAPATLGFQGPSPRDDGPCGKPPDAVVSIISSLSRRGWSSSSVAIPTSAEPPTHGHIRRIEFRHWPMSMSRLARLKHVRSLSTSSHSQLDHHRTAGEIAAILHHHDWELLLRSSDLPQRLNPDVVLSVLCQNQVRDPKRLLSFFRWSDSFLGRPQNLHSFSILAVLLCDSMLFPLADGVAHRMIDTGAPVSRILDSLLCSHRQFSGGHDVVVFEVAISVYKRRGLLSEACSIFWVPRTVGSCLV